MVVRAAVGMRELVRGRGADVLLVGEHSVHGGQVVAVPEQRVVLGRVCRVLVRGVAGPQLLVLEHGAAVDDVGERLQRHLSRVPRAVRQRGRGAVRVHIPGRGEQYE